jgi:hypothetical protein
MTAPIPTDDVLDSLRRPELEALCQAHGVHPRLGAGPSMLRRQLREHRDAQAVPAREPAPTTEDPLPLLGKAEHLDKAREYFRAALAELALAGDRPDDETYRALTGLVPTLQGRSESLRVRAQTAAAKEKASPAAPEPTSARAPLPEGPLSTRQVLALGKDRVLELASKLGIAADPTRRGWLLKVSAAVARKTAELATAKTEPARPPKAGTVLIADGKGGFRPPTVADAPSLMALLDSLTAPKAA